MENNYSGIGCFWFMRMFFITLVFDILGGIYWNDTNFDTLRFRGIG